MSDSGAKSKEHKKESAASHADSAHAANAHALAGDGNESAHASPSGLKGKVLGLLQEKLGQLKHVIADLVASLKGLPGGTVQLFRDLKK
ncbi:MAG: hypothetical protein EOP09_16470, partial [Proteobacteria bacterium]